MKQLNNHTVSIIDADRVDTTLTALLRVGAYALITLSVIGSMYGLTGEPLPQPLVILTDLTTRTLTMLYGAAIQMLLGIIQYGARVRALRDRRWYLLYVWALSPSVWFNWQTYGVPMTEHGIVAALAWCIIIAADIAPEIILVRMRSATEPIAPAGAPDKRK